MSTVVFCAIKVTWSFCAIRFDVIWENECFFTQVSIYLPYNILKFQAIFSRWLQRKQSEMRKRRRRLSDRRFWSNECRSANCRQIRHAASLFGRRSGGEFGVLHGLVHVVGGKRVARRRHPKHYSESGVDVRAECVHFHLHVSWRHKFWISKWRRGARTSKSHVRSTKINRLFR